MRVTIDDKGLINEFVASGVQSNEQTPKALRSDEGGWGHPKTDFFNKAAAELGLRGIDQEALDHDWKGNLDSFGISGVTVRVTCACRIRPEY